VGLVFCKPFRTIRLWQIRGSFGHLAIEPELTLQETVRSHAVLQIKRYYQRPLIIGFLDGKSSNSHLWRLWKTSIVTVPRPIGVVAWVLLGKSRWGSDLIYRRTSADIDVRGSLTNSPPFFVPSHRSRFEGWRLLSRLGLDLDQPFVLLNVRDSSDDDPSQRATTFRDADLRSYQSSITLLRNSGFQVVRVGSRAEIPVGVEGLTDFSGSTAYSGAGDIFLASHCAFVISTQAGFDAATTLFRKPTLFTNVARISRLVRQTNAIHIFKHHWSADGRLTQNQIWASGAAGFHFDRQWEEAGIGLSDNSAEELCDATRELISRYLGDVLQTQEDLDNQRLFKKAYSRGIGLESMFSGPFIGRIGTAFLRANPEWLT